MGRENKVIQVNLTVTISQETVESYAQFLSQCAVHVDTVLQVVVIWVVTPCSPVGGYQRFGWTYCFHLQCSPCKWRQYVPPECQYPPTGLHGDTTGTTTISTLPAVETRKLINTLLKLYRMVTLLGGWWKEIVKELMDIDSYCGRSKQLDTSCYAN
jgi:hypothetical protein